MGGAAEESELFSRVIVVLHRPKSPGNVGSVARAMKNMGFGGLALADPMAFDDPSYFDTEARRLAWDAADIVDARREEPTLAGALAGCTLVAGTSSHPATGALNRYHPSPFPASWPEGRVRMNVSAVTFVWSARSWTNCAPVVGPLRTFTPVPSAQTSI